MLGGVTGAGFRPGVSGNREDGRVGWHVAFASWLGATKTRSPTTRSPFSLIRPSALRQALLALERPALRLPDMFLVTSSLVALQTSARDAAAETLGRLAR
jgi:hypothetical protein